MTPRLCYFYSSDASFVTVTPLLTAHEGDIDGDFHVRYFDSELTRGLTNLSALLDKAAAHAAAKKFDSAVLAQSRLFPDMLPLVRQVQIACDTAKGAAGRLAGIEVPKHEDTEATFADLKARIAKTAGFRQDRSVRRRWRMRKTAHIEIKFQMAAGNSPASAYCTDFVLPNFYFHISIAYALLRKAGVEIGKSDFLGAIQ